MAKYRGRPSWASLPSEKAEIMLGGAYVRAIPNTNGSSSTSTHATSPHHATNSSARGARQVIEDGSPGPREEMRVTARDGYVLMIAQIG